VSLATPAPLSFPAAADAGGTPGLPLAGLPAPSSTDLGTGGAITIDGSTLTLAAQNDDRPNPDDMHRAVFDVFGADGDMAQMVFDVTTPTGDKTDRFSFLVGLCDRNGDPTISGAEGGFVGYREHEGGDKILSANETTTFASSGGAADRIELWVSRTESSVMLGLVTLINGTTFVARKAYDQSAAPTGDIRLLLVWGCAPASPGTDPVSLVLTATARIAVAS